MRRPSWLSGLWYRFFKFHNIPVFKHRFTIPEWQNFFCELGAFYSESGFSNWMESKEFEVFSTTEGFKFEDEVKEGFESVNRQLNLDFRFRNLSDPNLVEREGAEKLSRDDSDRGYGILTIFDYLDPWLPDRWRTFGGANPTKGTIKLQYDPQADSKGFRKEIRGVVSHELLEALTPHKVPHCNMMAIYGEYMINSANPKKYHTKRCCFTERADWYRIICPLCKDMVTYFLKGIKEG